MCEASIGWMAPWHLAYCGEIDATGLRRPASYYREVVWKTGKNPIVAFVRFPDPNGSLPNKDFFPSSGHREWVHPDLHPSWTWRGQEGNGLQVMVYSELPEVELFLNGISFGRKSVSEDTKYRAEYRTPACQGSFCPSFASGRLVAEDRCTHFSFHTYDREVERYGGPEACTLAERIFGADSRAAIELLRLALAVSDPIGSGFVASMARPGGNITGFTVLHASIAGKYLEILKEMVPQLTRVAIMYNPNSVPEGGCEH